MSQGRFFLFHLHAPPTPPLRVKVCCFGETSEEEEQLLLWVKGHGAERHLKNLQNERVRGGRRGQVRTARRDPSPGEAESQENTLLPQTSPATPSHRSDLQFKG